jgi:hypothetical protein
MIEERIKKGFVFHVFSDDKLLLKNMDISRFLFQEIEFIFFLHFSENYFIV